MYTCDCSMPGGLSTVILTDAMAVFIMVIGGLVLCVIGEYF